MPIRPNFFWTRSKTSRVGALSIAGILLACGASDDVSHKVPEQLKVTGSAANSPRPNILMIVVDTLRKDHLSAYGYSRPTSRNIEILAAEGVRYDRAFSQAPWTTPSVASMLTSKYPTTLRIHNIRNFLQDEFFLLPEVLKEVGYTTGGIVSHNFLNSEWGFDQGYDSFNEEHIGFQEDISSPGVAADAVAFIDQQTEDAPFFLFLHFFDPHYNYLLHDQYDFPAGLDYEGPLEPGTDIARIREMELNESDMEYLHALYDSEIAFTDEHIGRVLDHLRSKGQLKNTLVVLTTDHGEEFDERGYIGHGHELFNEAINVPLILKYPKDFSRSPEAGSIVEETVSLVDLFPTILDVLGLEVGHEIEGRSLLASPAEPGTAQRPAFSQNSRLKEVNAVVVGDLKLVYYYADSDPARQFGLYDMRSDPDETVNLIGERVEEAEKMKKVLFDWRDRIEQAEEALDEIDLNPEQIKLMKKLGYLKP